MRALPALALILASGVSHAQQPPTPKRIEGVSEAGNALFAKAQSAPDPAMVTLVRQQRQLRDQLNAAGLAAKVDPDKVEALLRQSEEVAGQIRTRNNDRLLAVLRALPEADRAPFLRGVLTRPVR
jgi:hypothetical protein